MQEVSVRGQSRKSSEEGLQDELDVCVLVLHLGLRHRPYLEQNCCEVSCFPGALSAWIQCTLFK